MATQTHVENSPARRSIGLLAGVILTACAPAASPPTTTLAPTSANAWVEQTLASLSLREKAGQLIMPWIGGDYLPINSERFDSIAALVERSGVGGFVVSVGLPLSYAAKLNALQQRARVPLLIASDMENGPGMRMSGIYSFPHLLPQGGGTEFPSAMALGATGSDTLAYELGRVLAREARAVGVHVTFGPVLDVNSNPANPIINTRSFGEDPELVGRLAGAYIRGAHDGGLLTTGKHFPGHGDTDTDSHLALPAIRADRARLEQIELAPFRTAVKQGVDAIMTAHIAVTGIEGDTAPPATLSRYFMTDVLRTDMRFPGLLFTDAMNMGAVIHRYGEGDALLRALDAGADVLLMPRDVPRAVETIVSAVNSGRIGDARLDASVRRLLQAKAQAGLDRQRFVPLDSVASQVGIRPHLRVAQTISNRSITLARDQKDVVPFAANVRRILSIAYVGVNDPIAGSHFDRTLASGGRAVTSVRVDARTRADEFAALQSQADSADAILVSMYVSPVEGTGPLQTRGAFATFLPQLVSAAKPVVVVSFGSPYVLAAAPNAPAYLLAWGGAEVSQRAAAQALLGGIRISGTLPVSLPSIAAKGTSIQRSPR
jgi:beta-N-acetylhexosaminidase